MIEDYKFVASVFILILFLLGAGWVLIDDDALRDDSVLRPKPYSLARVQLWWWSVLVLGSWILLYGLTGTVWAMNATCLTLLGISAVTTSAGRLIDNRAAQEGAVRHQDHNGGRRSFFPDILSDEQGLSVHRFQSVAFNVMYGVAFLLEAFTDIKHKKTPLTFPSLDSSALALLAISAGTYVTLKGMENDSPGPGVSAPKSVAPTNGTQNDTASTSAAPTSGP